MKYLLLSIGLVCYLAGVYAYLTKEDEQENAPNSNFLMIVGFLLILANCFYLWYNINSKMGITSYIPLIFLGSLFLLCLYVGRHDVLKKIVGTFIALAVMLVITFAVMYIPPVTLGNEVIKMGGRYGGGFKISTIQSADTVSVYPKPLHRRGGGNGQITHYGNFDVQSENKQAKLCIYLNNPPYIKIRMNDNSLFILNFKEPDKTVEFYNQIKSIIKK